MKGTYRTNGGYDIFASIQRKKGRGVVCSMRL